MVQPTSSSQAGRVRAAPPVEIKDHVGLRPVLTTPDRDLGLAKAAPDGEAPTAHPGTVALAEAEAFGARALASLDRADAPPLSERYRIEVPAYRFEASDLAWGWQRSVLHDQVGAVAGFLADLHDKTGGSRNVAFDRVRLEPARFRKAPLAVEGRTLVVSVPRPPLAFGPQSIDDLARRFAKGEHLPKPARKLWPLLNPAGPLRMRIEAAVAKVQGTLSSRLSEVSKSRRREDLQSSLRALVESHVDPEAVGADGQNVKAAALKKIAALRTPGLRKFAQRWLQQLEDPDLAAAVPEAMAGGAEAVRTKDVKVKQRVFSLFVGVSNVHDIGVDLHLSDGRLLPYVTQVPSKVDIDAVVVAPLVATHTVDLVQVDLTAQRHSARLIPTATLDWALRSH